MIIIWYFLLAKRCNNRNENNAINLFAKIQGRGAPFLPFCPVLMSVTNKRKRWELAIFRVTAVFLITHHGFIYQTIMSNDINLEYLSQR